MSAIIGNLRSLQRMGIFADRDVRSPDLQLRRYNLIYGFNGSGKSTLSRLFASLQAGSTHTRLPEGCSFEVTMTDGTILGCPSRPNGLERRLVVFNSDYVEQNLQWTTGHASPVFFIGADQAEAAAKLSKIEGEIASKTERRLAAENNARVTEKALADFKRERAKLTASRLHLGNRKYEAPALAKDYESWKSDDISLLTNEELEAAEEVRRRAEPLPAIPQITLDTGDLRSDFERTLDICGRSISSVALDEAQRFPDMLLWLKAGHEFHASHALEQCLFCGNVLSPDRSARLKTALDSSIDDFLDRITSATGRLQYAATTLATLHNSIPQTSDLANELRSEFASARTFVVREADEIRAHFAKLAELLSRKRERPATPLDLSTVANRLEIEHATDSLAERLRTINALLGRHNALVEDFAMHKEQAEIAIRKHFISECRAELAGVATSASEAQESLSNLTAELDELRAQASVLQEQIREHAPAATAINKLVASYLGHGELTIHPIDQGYELRRHLKPIVGAPSEGEKTAIALAYFLSSLEAEGRKLKDLIVVVDDPVSSLDTKALNYACSLVRSRLEGAGQAFVLTHNLQCMNELRKHWKGRVKGREGKPPTATFLFLDVCVPAGQSNRSSRIVEMSRLLREYDSEYHFLFSHVLKFTANGQGYDEHGYMMPNLLRRVLDVFLAFKCPGNSGLSGQIDSLCSDYPELDRDRLSALERLTQVESHSDNLDDLLSFSSMTIEETREAASSLLDLMALVDPKHLAKLNRLCG